MKYILVHGTNDGPDNGSTDSWWRQGSEFCTELGVNEDDIIRFTWDGKNSDRSRRLAANDLSKTVNRYVDYRNISIIAHSHGGNIAIEAIKKSIEKGRKDIYLFTVGTAFFSSRTFAIWSRSFWVPIISTLFFLAFALLSNAFVSLSQWIFIFLIALFVLSTSISIGALVYYPLVKPLIIKHRLNKIKSFAIFHPKDEAISLLKSAMNINLKPANNMTTFRAMGKAILPISLISGCFFFTYLFLGILQSVEQGRYNLYSTSDILGLSATGLYAPIIVIFVSILLLNIIFFILSYPLTPILNGVVNGALKSVAVGEDDRKKIGKVNLTPNKKNSELIELPDQIASELSYSTGIAIEGSARKFRDAFVGYLNSHYSDSLGALLTVLNWDELVHTSYFRHAASRKFIIDKIHESTSS